MKQLKTLALFLFAAVAFAFTACSKTDDKDYEVKMLGKWEMSEVVTITESNDTTYSVGELYEHLCSTKKDYLHFKSEGIIETGEFNQNCEINKVVSNWEVNGDQLTIIHGPNDKAKATILSLENGKLTLRDDDATNSIETYWLILNLVK